MGAVSLICTAGRWASLTTKRLNTHSDGLRCMGELSLSVVIPACNAAVSPGFHCCVLVSCWVFEEKFKCWRLRDQTEEKDRNKSLNERHDQNCQKCNKPYISISRFWAAGTSYSQLLSSFQNTSVQSRCFQHGLIVTIINDYLNIYRDAC